MSLRKALEDIATLAVLNTALEPERRLEKIELIALKALFPEESELALQRATAHARTHARDKGAAPHWLRCLYIDTEKRCVLSEGHAAPHEYVKEKLA